MNTLVTKNGESFLVSEIPFVPYQEFTGTVLALLHDYNNHVVHYISLKSTSGILPIVICIANDATAEIHVVGFEYDTTTLRSIESITLHNAALHIFERDLWERHGIAYQNHPWLKPVRFPKNSSHGQTIDDYAFFRIEGGEIHEVGVGPIHAGVIEPGHFRFQCVGEEVVHLEIKLGYQHRGVEGEFVKARNDVQRSVIAESIAGDTSIGNAWAHAMCMEGLRGITPDHSTQADRTIALELERIAIHMGDLSALNTDVAYQLGSAVFGTLRTPLINYFQHWCGNRFGKGLIRPGYNRFELTTALQNRLSEMLDDINKQYTAMAEKMFNSPSVVNRFEGVGAVPENVARKIGVVGMPARTAGILRDVRISHPFGVYGKAPYPAILLHTGDVLARAKLRRLEIDASMDYMQGLLADPRSAYEARPTVKKMPPRSMVISMVEAWRGELAHIVLTDEVGEIEMVRVKDPSMHNWFALAQALRNTPISDFPINNKSFDLSYCGHDL
ncbi:MAG: NADH dehydrogenase subunit [Ignavibacteria bacterium]|nr:NADH dehydrogenase subunit [Ignavibacteria bacterium]